MLNLNNLETVSYSEQNAKPVVAYNGIDFHMEVNNTGTCSFFKHKDKDENKAKELRAQLEKEKDEKKRYALTKAIERAETGITQINLVVSVTSMEDLNWIIRQFSRSNGTLGSALRWIGRPTTDEEGNDVTRKNIPVDLEFNPAW